MYKSRSFSETLARTWCKASSKSSKRIGRTWNRLKNTLTNESYSYYRKKRNKNERLVGEHFGQDLAKFLPKWVENGPQRVRPTTNNCKKSYKKLRNKFLINCTSISPKGNPILLCYYGMSLCSNWAISTLLFCQHLARAARGSIEG